MKLQVSTWCPGSLAVAKAFKNNYVASLIYENMDLQKGVFHTYPIL